MSYARFSEGDVYVFMSTGNAGHSGGWLECCGCLLNGPVWIPPREPFFPEGNWAYKSRRFFTTADMFSHLAEHVEAGHEIPDHCYEGLSEAAEENDAEIAGVRWAPR